MSHQMLAQARPPFRPPFLWGAAASAFQVEGATTEDGRGESIWDRFCATPGKVVNGDTGAIACDFYHRSREDIALMKELGLDAFRFSISWPRVLPEGTGRLNTQGLDFYDRLVDDLLENGIQPFGTLYHWDLPQVLEDAGGWPVRDTAQAFVEFTSVVAERLGDRVNYWVTHNEPWVAAWLGYGKGEHAPGRASQKDALAAAHHLLLSHGRAVAVLRELSPGAQVGITLDLEYAEPASASDADAAATIAFDGSRNRWFLEAIHRGAYPADAFERFGDDVPTICDGDMETISTPLDFLGVNYYQRILVSADPISGEADSIRRPGLERTGMGWEVYPDGLYALLIRIAGEYGPNAIHVTENGAAYPDVVQPDGSVDDRERLSYIARHVAAIERAIADGVPVEGYFAWTFLDNFEWAWGYAERFGIVYVDYETLERVPKASFHWYRDFIASKNGAAP
jgi:beta-glucosidase